MRIVAMNILDVDEGIICHQVNCLGHMGAGLAKQIKEKYPLAYKGYREYLALFGGCLPTPLGTTVVTESGEATPRLSVAHLFGQERVDRNHRQTNYYALASALRDLSIEFCAYPRPPIHIPYGMGAGLGGGDWEFISTIIEEWAALNDFDVTICQLPEKEDT